MITVKIVGGFGNQLYSFACGYSIAKEFSEELVLDVADFHNGYCRPYALDALNLPVYKKMTYRHALGKMLTSEVIPVRLRQTFDQIIDESDGIKNRKGLIERVSKGQNIYLNGYWGNFDFCSENTDDLRSMIKPLNPSAAYDRFLKTISRQCSVAVHLRRKDFVHLQSVCSDDYYRAAMVYIQSIHPDAVFYFFSDDIDYAKEHFGNKENFRYIQIFGGMDADLDEFFCLSACNHRILSQKSSYSDWASFLNDSPGKMDIIYVQPDAQRPEGLICLDDQQIQALAGNCDPMPRFDVKNIAEAKSCIEGLIAAGQHKKSVRIIDEISLDAYSVKQADYVDFLEMKAVVNMQDGNPQAAEQCLQRQAQYIQESENFQANCFAVSSTLGKTMESAIHAARCANLTRNTDLRDGLDQYFMEDTAEYDLYKLMRHTPKKHFIIAPNSGWFYYIKTPQSVAVILAKMGHSVSYIYPPSVKTASGAETLDQIVNACVASRIACDSLYSYGFYLYPSILNNYEGKLISYVEPLIEHLSRTSDGETVVLFRNPNLLINPQKEKYAKFIYWDFQNELDSENFCTGVWDESQRINMCRMADHAIITNREFYELALRDPQVSNAVFFTHCREEEPDEDRLVQERIGFTPNYLADKQTMALAAYILELSSAR